MKKSKLEQDSIENTKPLVHEIFEEELFEDNKLILAFTIPGQPVTKKNSQRIFRRRIMPSKAYCAYEAYCEPYCLDAWHNKNKSPIDYGVSINLKVYLKNWIVGDCTGYQQSLADIMEKFLILKNDSWIHWDWEGHHWFCGVDKENPRVEITVKRYRHPKEEFRALQEKAILQKEERKQAKLKKSLT